VAQCDEPTHADLAVIVQRQSDAISEYQRRADQLQRQVQMSAAIPFATGEISRTTAMIQAGQSRLDQTLALLVAGYAILASGATAVSVSLANSDPKLMAFSLASLCGAAVIFTIAVFMRDLVNRLARVEHQQAEARIRNYLTSVCPELIPYLSGPINDDFPTLYSRPHQGYGYAMWRLMLTAASLLIGLAAGSTAFAIAAFNIYVGFGVGTLLFCITLPISLTALERYLTKKRRSYRPRFPGNN
jgi:hypothetical protein